ncbi:hypothetical protein Pedsa_2118 [Pseudopedobacter saltans DSM 12145]|uniref:Outer membrane protein beta-barrel domain-containing protein n=1 Tax=Pseudopedobacter saltans (strain ATCC 51119 / DSM 12145 / JCM 21818 / CCUG 39354 / LMG 10337 / NBRC 100064 / NCIMB 13643) TaxID=762903 RepID=F0SB35_PSESL|nr:DUF6588 family protein [Pseudopedobacter saltans]ADY52670.1 hypothetical protein Pedsa_2118 [Pseudopedobacter saltans DSM 12145]
MRVQLSLAKSILLSSIIFLSAKSAFSQGDAIDLIKAREDATKITQAYLNPFFKGLGSGMNNGWFNSAKAKNLGKFDLRIQASGAFVPTSDQTFDVNSLGLTRFKPASGSSSITPTVFGKDDGGITLTDKNNSNIEFQMPSGAGFHIVPSPQIQLTVGLVYDTEISARFTPKVGNDDFGKVGSWGIGVKKEITKLLPWKTEKIIPIDLAVALGYNQINYDHKVAVKDQIGDDDTNDLKQRIEGKFSGVTADLIVSKKLAIFTPFASIGYNSAKTDIGILGTYKFNGENDLVDPVRIKQTDVSAFRGSLGFGLHLAFFRLYGAYNISDYQSVTAGIGFGIGK